MRLKRTKVNKYEQRIDATLDLHGYYQADATSVLFEFLKEATDSGYKKVMIITGKGIHSVNQQAVLKDLVEDILKHHGYSFTEAKMNEGGSGALVVKV